MPEPSEPAKTPGSGNHNVNTMAGAASGVSSNNITALSNGHKETEGSDVNPFAEYMWMENEEEYNRQVEEELLEQEFIDRCFEEMLNEEEADWFIPSRDLTPGAQEHCRLPSHSLTQEAGVNQLQQHFNGLSLANSSPEGMALNSSLNPEAKEFVPGVKY